MGYLDNKVAVVTGSGRGIGRAIALGFAAEGAKVVTNNRRQGNIIDTQLAEEKLDRLAPEQREFVLAEYERYGGDAETTAQKIRSSGGEAVSFFGDISDFDTAGELIRCAVDNFGSVDILVNVAGAFGFSPFEKMMPELFNKVNEIKPKGYFNTCRHAVPYMLDKGWGRIINCTSRSWLGDIIRQAEYCTANAGAVGLTRAIAVEYKYRGITCNAFAPFARTRASVDLEMYDKAVDTEDRAWDMDSRPAPAPENIPLAEEFVPFLVYLCTDQAARITGSVFSLAGNTFGLYSDPEIIRSVSKPLGEHWTVDELVKNADRMMFAGYRSVTDQYK